MRTLFLHIGQGKTGSSFLQAAFAASAGALLEAGIRYPAGAGGHERALSGGITSGNGVLLTEALAGEERLAALLADGDGADLAFSREQLSYELLRDGVLDRLERVAHAAGFGRIAVLLFIRDPVEQARSDYVQTIKRGRGRHTVEDHFRAFDYPVNAALLLEAIARRPAIDLTVRNYSRVRDRLLDCAAAWLGIDGAKLVRPAGERVNRALTPDELRLVRRLNEASEVAGKLIADRLCEALPRLAGPSPLPPLAVQEEMLARLRPAIEAVDRRIDPDHRYRLAPAAPPPVDDGDGPIRLSDAQVEVIAAALGWAFTWRDDAIRGLSARAKTQADRIARQHERIEVQQTLVDDIGRKLRDRDLALAVARGELALARGRPAHAVRAFERALGLDPSRADVRALLERAQAVSADAGPEPPPPPPSPGGG